MNFNELKVGQRLLSKRDPQRPWVVRVEHFDEYNVRVYSEDWKDTYTIRTNNLMNYEVIDDETTV